jgi:hypothetical protein
MEYYYQNDVMKSPLENFEQDDEHCLNELRRKHKSITGKGMMGVGRMTQAIKRNGRKEYAINIVHRGPQGAIVDFIKKNKLQHLTTEAIVLRHKEVFKDTPQTIQKAVATMKEFFEDHEP